MSLITLVQVFFAEMFDVAEKVLIILSHWLVLVSFYEANWWHFSDPNTTGISLKAIVIIVLTVFLPTVLFKLKQFLFRKRIHFVVLVLLKVLLIVLLFLSSLPTFARFPWIRTGLLAVGCGVSPLLLTVILPISSRPIQRYMCKRGNFDYAKSCLPPAHKQSNSLGSETYPFRLFLNEKLGSRDSYSEAMLLVAVLLSMVIRWAFATVNVFYETWQASLVFLICLALFSSLGSYRGRNINFYSDSRNRKSIGSASTHTEIVVATDIGDKPSSPKSVKHGSHQELFSMNCRNSLVKLNSLTDDGDTLSTQSNLPSTFDKTFSDNINFFKSSRLALLFFGGVLQGLALGTLILIFLWVFNTPNLLVRWSRESPETHGILVILFFAVGLVLSLCFKGILDTSCRLSSKKKFKNEQITCSLVDILVLAFLIGLLISAAVLQLQDSTGPYSFIGSSMFCVALPCCLTINLIGIKRLLGLCTYLHTSPSQLSIFLSVVAFFTALAFLFSHVTLISFINPQIFPLFLGRMDIILAYQVLVIIASLTTTTISNRLFYCCQKQYETDAFAQSTLTGNNVARISVCKLRPVALLFVCMILLSTGCVVQPVFTPGHCVHLNTDSYQILGNASRRVSYSSSVFSVLSWNVLLGHDKYGRDNMPCVAKTLQLIKPDVIGLQESEAIPPYWGSKDIPAYLSGFLGEGVKHYLGVQPLKSSLGVALLTNRTVTKHESYLLPGDDTNKLPHYSMVKIDCLFDDRSISIFNVHAVFKNWTATENNLSPFAYTSEKQIKFIAEKILSVDQEQPIIVMGDFNLNPNEPQLDILHKLGFRSALHKRRDLTPPSTLRNRFAIVDHIFYRGLILSESRKVVETKDISDHIPVMAYFHLPT